jgi:hypothetical protein
MAMADVPSIAPSLARLDRADESIVNLATELPAFIESDPYDAVVERDDSNPLVYTITITDVRTIPLWLRVLAGEIAHHLRSAFDLLVYQLLLAQRVTDEKRLSLCAFPVRLAFDAKAPKEVQKYEDFMRRKIGGVSPESEERLRSFQPHLSETPAQHFLAQIDSLDNTDKHRLLLALVSGVDVSRSMYVDGISPPVPMPPDSYLPLHAGQVVKVEFPRPPDAVKLPFRPAGHGRRTGESLRKACRARASASQPLSAAGDQVLCPRVLTAVAGMCGTGRSPIRSPSLPGSPADQPA